MATELSSVSPTAEVIELARRPLEADQCAL
jgi:hypothetical protein